MTENNTNIKPIIIKTENLDETAPLYCQYPQQCNPQPAYVEIDPRGDNIEVSAGYSGEIGSSISGVVWHRLVSQVSVSPYVYGPALIDFLKSDDFEKIVRELCDGYEEYWDGSNHRGRWNNWSDDTEYNLELELKEIECAEIWNGADWIEGDVKYYDEDGDEVVYQDDAHSAVYGSGVDKIEITRENLGKLVEDAESWADNHQKVEDLETAFEYIIETLEDNRE